MEIREIQIDGFGVFSASKLKGVSSGLNIIYGPNEFGKTTLLEFIRCMLVGFPVKTRQFESSPGVNEGPESSWLWRSPSVQYQHKLLEKIGSRDYPY